MTIADLANHGQDRHVGHEDAELDDVRERGTSGRKGQPQILENALCLGHRIVLADQLAVLVHRDLTRDRHQPSARADSVAVPVAGRHPGGAR